MLELCTITPPPVACLINAGLQAHVFTPQDLAYQASIESYFSNTAKLQPACVFIPESTEQVPTAIKALVTAEEKFAIRSGGQAPLGGSNNLQSGVTIDLSHLNRRGFGRWPDRHGEEGRAR